MINNPDLLIECENVKKEFHLGDVVVNALRGVNLKVYRGEFIAIMGASGSGKTTLLNIIGSLDAPSEGSVSIEGKNLALATEQEITKYRRSIVGFVFQFYNLLPVLSAFENVELPLLIAGVEKEERRIRAEALIESVGLSERAKHKPEELSGGERQRVAIARALANNPSLLLMDEPTGDLDTETGIGIMELIVQLNESENQSIILVTHDHSIAEYAKNIYQMVDGKITNIFE